MGGDLEPLRTQVEVHEGKVFLVGKPLPLSMTTSDAIDLADRLVKAATIALSQQTISKIDPNVEWI